MSEDKEVRVSRPSPDIAEKRDAATVAAVVSAGASIVSAGAAVWSATQQGKPEDPPPPPPPPPPSIELPAGVDGGE